jgi:hypothetical protein
MARFEFGKGKKKTYWDVEQLRRVVRTQETEPHCARLSGYRTFPDEPTAQREIGKLVSEHLSKGFVPADDAARALAATAPPPTPRKSAPPALPVRRDLDIYNEANGFMVLSMKMAGVAMDEGSAKWNKAVADAKMIPVMLFQDDPFTVRVVAGDKLTPQESEEWVARVDWWLNVPDGKLAVTGGAILVNDEYDEDDPYYKDYIGVVELPPGFYRATVYSYVPGVNGSAVLDHLAGGYEKGEPLGRWFRRTRPHETFPAWLRYLCVAIPSTDPDHKEEWKLQKRPSDAEMPDYIHFLVHFEPAAKEDKSGKPAIEEGQGWFGEAEGGRKPDLCPLGLEGHNVVRSKETEVPAGNWIYVEDVYQRIRPFESVPIDGGLVELDLSVLPDLYRLAWFTVFQSVPEIRLTLPAKGVFNLPKNWPAESVAREQDGVWRISFSNNLRPVQMIPVVAKVAEHLATLPEGTELELVSSQLNEEALHGRVPVGSHRYGGQLAGGKWRLKEAFPKVDAATLRDALSLCAEATVGDAITIKDGEADAVMKWAKGNHGPWIEDNPGTIENGRLTLGKRDPVVLNLYAASVFGVRFGKVWPVLNLAEDEDDDVEEQDDKPINAGIPVQGKKILETPGGRMYFATMALLLSEKLAGIMQKEEKVLQGLGFKHVGDVVCNLFPKIAVRGYAQKEGDTWASYFVAFPDTLPFEMSTRFEKDAASLVTTRRPGAPDDVSKHSYRQSVEGDFAEMLRRHDARKQELIARYGPPIKAELTHASLAEAVEAALKKRLGG